VSETFEGVKAGIVPIGCAVAGMLVLLFDLAGKGGAVRRWVVPTATVAFCAGLIVSLLQFTGGIPLVSTPGSPAALHFGGATVADGLGAAVTACLCLAGLGAVLLGGSYISDRNLLVGEYHGLVLFSAAGAMWMVQSADLISAFVGLEVLSVALYVLAGYLKGSRASGESAVKYFLLGAFASAFLLYGIVLVYGATGMAVAANGLAAPTSLTRFDVIGDAAVAVGPTGLLANPVFAVGLALIIVGLGFKASLAPFHHYAPDVYEGAPLPVVAFLSTAAKIAAFGVLVRMCHAVSNSSAPAIPYALSALALLTMIVGNAYALRQTKIKRVLAGSSIAHAGYLAAGLTALFEPSAQRFAIESILYYLVAYTITNVGVFAVLLWLARRGAEPTDVRELDGLARRQPMAAGVLTLLVLSLAGLPPSIGFLGKLSLFLAVVKSGNLVVALGGLLCSAIGTAVYFGLLIRVYFRNAPAAVPEPQGGVARLLAVVAAVLVLVWGVLPLPWFNATPNGQPVANVASTP